MPYPRPSVPGVSQDTGEVHDFFNTHDAEPEQHLPEAERVIAGRSEQTTWNHYSDPSGSFHAGVWEAQPGRWRIRYTEHEYCRILEGRSILRDRTGHERALEAGDEFVIPAGFEGEWEVVLPTRKVHAIFKPGA